MPTYWTPDGPRRMSGTSVRYSRSSTAFYKSQRARFVRAMSLNIARRQTLSSNSRRFWFRSPRGPADTGGHWIVNAVRTPGAPGGWGTPYVPPPPIDWGGEFARRVWTKVIYEWYAPSDFKSASLCYRVRGPLHRIEAPGYGAAGPFFNVGFGLNKWDVGPFTTTFRRASMTIHATGYFNFCSNHPGPPIPGPSQPWMFINTTFQWRDYYVPGGAPPTPALYQLYLDLTLGPSILGPSQTPFPDVPGMPGVSPPSPPTGWEYTCTCPDYKKSEGPLHIPLFPSQRSLRSWVDSNAGADPYCKHIYAAAFALADQDILSNIPDGPLSPALEDDFYGYLDYISAFRQQVYRARAAQYALNRRYNREGYDAGIAARDRYYDQLNVRDALAQDRLRDRYFYRANGLPVPPWQPEVPYVVPPTNAADRPAFYEAVAARQAFIDAGGPAGLLQRQNDFIAANPGSLQRLRLLNDGLSPALIPPARGVEVGNIPANYDPARRVAGNVLMAAGGVALFAAVLPGPGLAIAAAGAGVASLGSYIHPD